MPLPCFAADPPAPDPNTPEAPEELTVDPLTPDARRALAGLLGEGRVVAHHPCFARVFGGAACGLLLSQFWFWAGTATVQERTGGWFWKAQHEITEETGLSRAETRTARRRLCALGVLQEERRGIPATLHFRLDREVLLRLLWHHAQASPAPYLPVSTVLEGADLPAETDRSCVPNHRTFVRGVRANKSARSRQTTSEKTSEKTSPKTSETVQAGAQTPRQPVLPAAVSRVSSPAASRVSASPRPTALPPSQCAVNRQGAARFKEALEAARCKARPREESG